VTLRMNTDQLIGNRWVRAAAVAAALCVVIAAGAGAAGVWPAWHRVLRFVAWSSGFVALLAGVHWSGRIFSRWMQAAGVLNTITTTLLFGACYFVIVPLFWAILQLRRLLTGRRRPRAQWQERDRADADLAFFQRMG